MATFAVLPLKPWDVAKSRLARADRARLAGRMAASVLHALRAARRLDGVVVVTADPMVARRAAVLGAHVVDEGSPRGHDVAARLGIERAVALGATRVLLVPGDCPLLRGEDVDLLLARHRIPGVVIVPDRHGTGTNALLLRPPDAIRTAFGDQSFARHLERTRDAGLPAVVDVVPSLLHDVDTVDDLEALGDPEFSHEGLEKAALR